MVALSLAALLVAAPPSPDALVVLSRHSGEVLRAQGEIDAALPPEVARRAGLDGEAWGAVLRSLGSSALGVARALRLAAESRPGPLAARRTGQGLAVAVEPDLVLVAVHPGLDPALMEREAERALARLRSAAVEPARVQVFGLLQGRDVLARCPRSGFAAARDGPVALSGEVRVAEAVRLGPLVCGGGPWLVTVPGAPRPRPYAGVFSAEPLSGPEPAAPGASAREARARRGSEIAFRTTRLLYAAGVVAAEDAASRGPSRVALARVADANGRNGSDRHPGRAACDTTHCQAFLGTARPGPEEREALDRPLDAPRWLPFSRGGLEPWRQARAAADVQRALGPGARSLVFHAGRVRWVSTEGEGAARREVPRESGCEVLRGPLRLPSCPDSASMHGDEVVFEGQGRGHGEGLDLGWAARSGLSADAILLRSYGPLPGALTPR